MKTSLFLIILVFCTSFWIQPEPVREYQFLGCEQLEDGATRSVWSYDFEDGSTFYTWQISDRTPYGHTFNCPNGVYGITVELWGGGGGGGSNPVGYTGSSGGGGGGAYVRNSYTTVPTYTYDYYVGYGGTGGYNGDGYDGCGSQGGNSYFINSTTLKAAAGGGANSSYYTPTGGAGGTIGNSVGPVIRQGAYGGAGVDNVSNAGGPGGSSAGFYSHATSEPSTWSTTTPLYPPEGGGRGAYGSEVGVAAFNATERGGGGGGAGYQTTSPRYGGNGASGEVRITYLTYGNILESF